MLWNRNTTQSVSKSISLEVWSTTRRASNLSSISPSRKYRTVIESCSLWLVSGVSSTKFSLLQSSNYLRRYCRTNYVNHLILNLVTQICCITCWEKDIRNQFQYATVQTSNSKIHALKHSQPEWNTASMNMSDIILTFVIRRQRVWCSYILL